MAVSPSRTSSSLNGLMIAITIFIAGFPRYAARKSAPANSLRLAHRRQSTRVEVT
jgi:hypothetical protein